MILQQPCFNFQLQFSSLGTVAACRAQRTGYPPPPRSGWSGVCESSVKVYQFQIFKYLKDLDNLGSHTPVRRFAGAADMYPVRCARQAATVPKLGNFVLEWRWEIVEICSKILPKMVPNPWKSSSGAVLEHFGDPLGAKMAQDRHQEQKNMKNNQFWGGLGGPK